MKAALRLKLELGVRSQESGGKSQKSEGKSQKAGARISVFTNMRCSLPRGGPLSLIPLSLHHARSSLVR
ncbi:hypothetical protein QUA82_05325 [Microcoleus sp. F8-D3]